MHFIETVRTLVLDLRSFLYYSRIQLVDVQKTKKNLEMSEFEFYIAVTYAIVTLSCLCMYLAIE